MTFMANPLLTPELLRRLEQFQRLATRRANNAALGEFRRRCMIKSAKRINMNSRGCQPTVSCIEIKTTLKGSHISSAHHSSPIQT